MMGEDLAIEARNAAVREVVKLLPLPELLQSIAAVKADYITRQQVPIHHYLLPILCSRFSFDSNGSFE